MREYRVIGVHVHTVHEPPWLVSAYGEQTDLGGTKAFVESLKMVAVGAVSGEINSPLGRIDEERPPQRLVRIPKPSARGMHRLKKDNPRIPYGHRVIPVHLGIGRNAFLLQQCTHPQAYQNRWWISCLSIEDRVNRFQVQMVVMVMADQDDVDSW